MIKAGSFCLKSYRGYNAAISAVIILLNLSCIPIKKIVNLPEILNENSGLCPAGDGIWFINDSGNEPTLYKTDFNGGMLRKLYVSNALNSDWEELCKDNSGNFYIGDFGNNLNSRKNLRIYKIKNPDLCPEDSISAAVLNFYYPEQLNFPAANNEAYYDAEAMTVFRDSVYIFTKNRTKPNDGIIKCYRLPSEFENNESLAAVLTGEFRIKNGHFFKSVTAAALSPDSRVLLLMGMGRIHIFSDFKGSDFFAAKSIRHRKIRFSQKEAIGFYDKNKFFISDEKSPLGKARLYKGKLIKDERVKMKE